MVSKRQCPLKVKNKILDGPSLRNSKADVSRVGPLIRAIASRSEEGLILEIPALEFLLLSAQLKDLNFRVFFFAVREGTFFLGGGLGNFRIFSPKSVGPPLRFN